MQRKDNESTVRHGKKGMTNSFVPLEKLMKLNRNNNGDFVVLEALDVSSTAMIRPIQVR